MITDTSPNWKLRIENCPASGGTMVKVSENNRNRRKRRGRGKGVGMGSEK